MSSPLSPEALKYLQALDRPATAGTSPRKNFERIARMAARLCEAPIALIVLGPAEQQSIRFCYGLDAQLAVKGLSFCVHTDSSDEVTVVEDAAKDPRFVQNPLVTGETGIRFYAGIPLKISEGFDLGTLSIFDRRPRKLSEGQRALLSDLAAMVVAELELHREVDEGKQAEQALRESEKRYRSVVENVKDVVFQTNAEGKWTFLNPAWTEITGFSREESLGRNFLEFVHPDDRARNMEHFLPLIARRKEYCRHAIRYLRKGSGYRWMEVHARLTLDPGDEIIGTSGTLSDITDTVRYEAEREAREKAEELLRLKSSFLNNMSHELRTPLTGILGFAEVLTEEVGEAQREFAKIITQSTKRLQETLNSVLSLAQLEGGEIDLHAEVLDVGLEVQDAISLLHPLAEKKGITLQTDVLTHDCLVLADRACLHRTLDNLVGNAIKFTEEGGVRVEVDADADQVYVRVKDSGIGISEQFLPDIFDEFRQESAGLTRSYEGIGLGLSITKRLVDLMEGTIQADSKLGQGSTFTVSLPRLRTHGNDLRTEGNGSTEALGARGGMALKADDVPALTILVVEDNPDTLKLIQHLLHPFHQVTCAVDAVAALEAAGGGGVDVVLLDINLSGNQSGMDVLCALRAMPAYKHVPMVAMTAYAMPGDRQHFLEAGFNHYLSKPFTKHQLLQVLNEVRVQKASSGD